MLREIFLTNFGRFRDRKFSLAKATVFYGPNEAGKTTVFDAVFYALCKPPATRRAGKLLRERYGPEADSRLLFTGDEIQLDEDEFRNLHAVRAGDVSAELGQTARWIEKVRANLFAGGLDPRELAERLRKQTKTGANLVHNRERRKLVERLEKIRTEGAELRARRERILGGEKRLESVRAEIARTTERLDRLRREAAELKERIAEEEALRDRRDQATLLADLESIADLERWLAERPELTASAVKEFDALAAATAGVSGQAEELERKLESRRDALEEERERLRALSGEIRLLGAMRAEAVLARDRLREFRETAWRTEVQWRPLPLVGGLLSFAAGAGGYWFAPAYGPLLALGAALAGAALLVFARRTRGLVDQAALARFAGRLRADWNRRFSQAGAEEMPAEDPEAYFSRIESRYDLLQNASAEREAKLAASEAALAADRARREELAAELERARATEGAWLAERGLTGRDELLLALSEIATRRQRLADLRAELARRYPDQDPGELKRDARRKLEGYDERGLIRVPLPDPEFRGLRGRLAELERGIKTLIDDEHRGQVTAEGLAGEMTGSLQGLPARIVDLERQAGELEAAIAAMDRDREAAGLAAEIFEELAADTELALQDLTRDLGELYREMQAERGGLRLADLELKNVLLEDGGGDLRPLEHCSTGTRDAFLLAARLVLARKTRPDVRLLVLDEPFLSLDAGREREVLEFLAAFQTAYDWQFVFFTKEERLRDAIVEIFPEAVLHEPAGTEDGAGGKKIARAGAAAQPRKSRRSRPTPAAGKDEDRGETGLDRQAGLFTGM